MLVVYMHGIRNKPPADVLKVQWDLALFGRDLGDRTRMAYWADLRYEVPLRPSHLGPTLASVPETRGVLSRDELLNQAVALLPEEGSDARTGAPADPRAFAEAFGGSLLDRAARAESELPPHGGPDTVAAVDTRVFPRPIRDIFTQPVLTALLPDTADYFFGLVPGQDHRRKMQDRLRSILTPSGGPYVIVAHSMGSVISYDVLCSLEGSGVRVPLYITCGSPLGMQEIEDHLTQPLRRPRCVDRWLNVAAKYDFVALDQSLSNDFHGDGLIEDALVSNPETARLDPHSGSGYLRTSVIRNAVRDVVGAEFSSPVGSFTLSRDLAAEVAGSPDRRVSVLVELGDRAGGGDLDAKRAAVVEALKSITGDAPVPDIPGDAGPCIDPLRHYVAARLTPPQLEVLASRHGDLRYEAVWKNLRKSALIHKSIGTVQAATAHRGYGADGSGINWAILDTGIADGHPHFQEHGNIRAMWDCTRQGPPLTGEAPGGRKWGTDGHGHGTHVAGIIAGSYLTKELGEVADGDALPAGTLMCGMAPRAGLHIYKTLDDEGHGEDRYILKALDHIAETNNHSAGLVIHGINLSLGGSFDPSVFQCGFSPLCREIRRLWRQGVLVCIAAGNEGRLAVLDPSGQALELTLDLSVGDPANLDEAIAVGSVHREQPQLYGISYFSSRGPTADGRSKPDLVAPGEKILSCNFQFATPGKPLYIAMSGTSMACPHVSGILAAFLSVHRQHVGYPERAKSILLANCSDLQRDRYHQGAGLPNLTRMLLNQ